MNIDRKTAKARFDITKSKGTYEITGFAEVSQRAAAHSKGSGYEYFFVGKNMLKEITIPDEIDGLPVIKVAVKRIPDDAIVFCRGELYAKMNRGTKASTARAYLEDPSRFESDEADEIKAFIKKYSVDTAKALCGSSCAEAYVRFSELAKIQPDIMECLLEGAKENPEVTAYLLNQSPKKKAKELSLDAPKPITVAEFKKIWTYYEGTNEETGEKEIYLANYKGSDEHVRIPAMLGKKPIVKVSGEFSEHVKTIEFENREIIVESTFRRCKAMADENGFIVLVIGDRGVLTDYIGPKDAPVLTLPDNVTEIRYGVLQKLGSREIILPEGLKNLNNNMFSDCSRLQHVYLPESLVEIGQLAFSDCTALQELYIPGNVTTIGFQNIQRTGLKTIYGAAGSAAEAFAEKENLMFVAGDRPDRKPLPDFVIKDGVLQLYVGTQTGVVIPEGIEEIDYMAFRNQGVMSVTMPAGLKRIGNFAFHDCKELRSVRFPEDLEEIGEYAFCECEKLEEITFPEHLQHIGKCAFQWCHQLERVSIPCKDVTIDDSAFNGCRLLSRIDLSSGVAQIGENAFSKSYGSDFPTIHAPAGSYAEQYAKENNIPFIAE